MSAIYVAVAGRLAGPTFVATFLRTTPVMSKLRPNADPLRLHVDK